MLRCPQEKRCALTGPVLYTRVREIRLPREVGQKEPEPTLRAWASEEDAASESTCDAASATGRSEGEAEPGEEKLALQLLWPSALPFPWGKEERLAVPASLAVEDLAVRVEELYDERVARYRGEDAIDESPPSKKMYSRELTRTLQLSTS